ncbi:hypothetical protein H0H93_012251 [Arthromyces matolae]|nr:hypothetical protein H0H93_012251 [Arthromyces matolae]
MSTNATTPSVRDAITYRKRKMDKKDTTNTDNKAPTARKRARLDLGPLDPTTNSQSFHFTSSGQRYAPAIDLRPLNKGDLPFDPWIFPYAEDQDVHQAGTLDFQLDPWIFPYSEQATEDTVPRRGRQPSIAPPSHPGSPPPPSGYCPSPPPSGYYPPPPPKRPSPQPSRRYMIPGARRTVPRRPVQPYVSDEEDSNEEEDAEDEEDSNEEEDEEDEEDCNDDEDPFTFDDWARRRANENERRIEIYDMFPDKKAYARMDAKFHNREYVDDDQDDDENNQPASLSSDNDNDNDNLPAEKEKHRQVSSRRVASFLDLEAADVTEEDDEEDEEDEELATFFDDDMPPAWEDADRALSEALNQEQGPLSDQWDSLLARARQRSQSTLTLQQKHAHESTLNLTPGFLWRVAVKAGHEESVAFALMQKALDTHSTYGVQSVIGQRSRPGWVYVECPSEVVVQNFCKGVSNIHRIQKIVAVPQEDTLSCLQGPPAFIPPSHSWVRLTRPPLYKNDLAYVLKYQPRSGAKLFFVPRVSLTANKHAGRPPQALLQLEEAQKSKPSQTKVFRTDPPNFEFKKHLYLEGYRCLKTFDFVPATPTEAELNNFINSTYVQPEAVQAAQAAIASSRLQIKDRVVVARGQIKGTHGVILHLDDDVATLLTTDYPSEEVLVPRSDVRKHFLVGDEVIVVGGPKKGIVAWIVSLTTTELTLFAHKSAEQFNILHSNVMFYAAPQVHTDKLSSPSFRLPSAASQDPLYHLKNQEVTVTGANPFKGYEGRVKETQNDGTVIVELQAGLHNVVLNPQNLSTRALEPVAGPSQIRTPSSMQPLTLSRSLPPSLVPAAGSQYTGLTPRPTPLHSNATPLSPAWDPSSEVAVTEREDLATFSNAFMFSERFKVKCAGIRVKIKIVDSDGTARNALWTTGSFDEEAHQPIATVGLKKEKVDDNQVSAHRPCGVGERVVVIDPHDTRFGDVLWMVEFGGDSCQVRGGVARKSPKDKIFSIPTSSLAVVARK